MEAVRAPFLGSRRCKNARQPEAWNYHTDYPTRRKRGRYAHARLRGFQCLGCRGVFLAGFGVEFLAAVAGVVAAAAEDAGQACAGHRDAGGVAGASEARLRRRVRPVHCWCWLPWRAPRCVPRRGDCVGWSRGCGGRDAGRRAGAWS